MAGELRGGLVQDERHVAVRALPDAPAHLTGEEVRPPAPVEQDDRLLPPPPYSVQLLARALVQRAGHPGHADHLHRRQRAAVDALAQLQPLVADLALRPRRGAAGEQQRALELRPPLRDHARVVAGVALLLVGRVVLLVDDDQPEVLERREHRRARADAHARLAPAHPPPLVVALALRQLGVHDRDGVAEALDEAPRGLRSQRDLGHEHDRRLAALERRGHRAQVDLGLAAAGHAVEQQGAPGRLAEALHDRLERRALGGRRLHTAAARAHALDDRASRRIGGLLEAHQAAPLETAQRRVVGPGQARHRGGAQRPRGQRVQHGALALSEPGVASGSTLVGERRPQRAPRAQRPRRAGPGAGRKHQRQPAGGRGHVLGGDPQPQPHERLRHVGLERRQRLHQPVGGHVAGPGQLHHHAEQPPPPEGDHQHAADADVAQVRAQEVVERPPQGARGRQRLDLGDHRPDLSSAGGPPTGRRPSPPGHPASRGRRP